MLTAPSLRTAARDVLTGEPAAVVVDVTEVTFLASVGIGALLDLCRQLAPSRPFAVAASGAATARPLAFAGAVRNPARHPGPVHRHSARLCQARPPGDIHRPSRTGSNPAGSTDGDRAAGTAEMRSRSKSGMAAADHLSDPSMTRPGPRGREFADLLVVVAGDAPTIRGPVVSDRAGAYLHRLAAHRAPLTRGHPHLLDRGPLQDRFHDGIRREADCARR
ncbi:STAS domain-containing protein [Rhodococcus sp. 2H158]